MWILPKQLLTSHFVQDTEASTLDLEAFCQGCEHALMWRSKPSLVRTWLQRCKKVGWMQLLSGQTLKPSTHDHFMEKWTSSLEDSHANHSVTQGNEKVQTILDTCSQISNELSESVNLECSSSKMSKGLFPPSTEELNNRFSTMCLSDWKQWVIEQRQVYLARRNASIRIVESASSSQVYATPTTVANQLCPSMMKHPGCRNIENWPTPTGIHADRGNHDEPLENYEKRVEDYEEGKTKGKPGKSLGVAARMEGLNWPTPRTSDTVGGQQELDERGQRVSATTGLRYGAKLSTFVNWATPNTMDHLPPGISGSYKESQTGRRKVSSNLRDQASEKWRTPSASPSGINPENLVDKEGNPPKQGQRVYDKKTGRLAQIGLEQQVRNCPTPDATNVGDGVPWEVSKKAMEERRAKVKQDVKDGETKQGSGRSANLAMSVQKPETWMTPVARDWKGAQGRSVTRNKPQDLPAQTEGIKRSHQDLENPNTSGKPQGQSVTRKLSPLWVAQLMGLPMATWCVINVLIHCAPLETE